MPRSPQPTDALGSEPAPSGEAQNCGLIRLPWSHPMTDEELVAAVAQADQGAMNQLYDRLYPSVDRTLTRVLGQRNDDYGDLIQIVFERVIASIIKGNFKASSSLTTWASAIASHVGIDEIRARQRRRKFFAPAPAEHSLEENAPECSVEGQLEARSAFTLVRQALATLNRKSAQILILYHLEGYSISEVAAALGMTSEACKSRLSRARQKFVRELQVLERGNEQ